MRDKTPGTRSCTDPLRPAPASGATAPNDPDSKEKESEVRSVGMWVCICGQMLLAGAAPKAHPGQERVTNLAGCTFGSVCGG